MTAPTVAQAARRAAADSVCCALGEVVANHRQAAGFSQDHLAAVVGVTQHMVSYWEAGRALMGSHHLLLVAGRLCIPAEVLLADAWADAPPCARFLVPAPVGEPVLLRWRRPPHRPRRAESTPVPEPSPGLAGRLRAAGLPAELASRADLALDDLAPVCQVGWQKGDCRRRPTCVAVRVNRTTRWTDSPARIVARTLCADHAARLDGTWIVVDRPEVEADPPDQDDALVPRRSARPGPYPPR